MDLTEKMYEEKYLKYKKKYAILKQQEGSSPATYTGTVLNSTPVKMLTGTKNALCSNWAYLFIFDEDYSLPSKYINGTETFTMLNDRVAYLAYKLIDENTSSKNNITFVTSAQLTKEKRNVIDGIYSGIVKPQQSLYQSSSDKIKNVSLQNANLFDIDLINSPKLITTINDAIEQSNIKIRKSEQSPKITTIVSFYGEKIQGTYKVEYNNPTKPTIIEVGEDKKNNRKINDETKLNIY